MASQAKIAKGTKLYRGGATSPESYNAIPEILEISGAPGGVPDLISVYNHDSPSFYDEVVTGRISQPDITVRCNYINDTQQNALKDDMEGGTQRFYKITWPAVGGEENVVFAARVRGFQLRLQPNEQQILEFTLAPDGAPFWSI